MASDLDLDAYLARIGERRPLVPALDAHVALHQARCAAIPFENLDILLGREIALDLPSLEAKLVRGRRGGYCFEQNTLFRAALEAMGFRVTSLAARVRAGTTEVRPRTHMLLRVAAGGPTSTPSRSSLTSRWTSRWPTTSRAPTLVRPSS